MPKRLLSLTVNGRTHDLAVRDSALLLEVLRESVGLTGTKQGCDGGECGACTVLVDGKARRSCQEPVSALSDKSITTIEGLAKDDRLHPVQQAFLDEGAMQCAYCTSGMIMSAVSLLSFKPNPSQKEIVDYMQGNICRCGTQPRIIAAIRRAAAIERARS